MWVDVASDDGANATATGVVRTTSWDFAGDRTDLHEIISDLWAVALRTSGVSSVCLDHLCMSGVPGEISHRILLPLQPSLIQLDDSDAALAHLRMALVGTLFATELIGSTFHALMHGTADAYSHEPATWEPAVREVFPRAAADESNLWMSRGAPGWRYFRSERFGVSAFELGSDVLKMWRAAAAEMMKGSRNLSGRFREITATRSLRNCHSVRTARKGASLAARIDARLGAESLSEDRFLVVPVESHLFVLGATCVVSLASESGLQQFKQERLRRQLRRDEEASVLYSTVRFRWTEDLDPELFEQLVLELLRTEPGVDWARKAGPTNERDQGRDLMALWHVDPSRRRAPAAGEEAIVATPTRVLVQCKTSARSVSKSKVTDIHDTLRLHDAAGYLLVAHPEPSNSLVNHLESMRRRGEYWVDWWSRNELEDRLRANPDIADRYGALVRVCDE